MTKLVALALPGGPDFVSALQRVWDEGNAVLPVDLRPPLRAQRDLLTSLGASRLIAADGSADLASGTPLEHDDALVIATSGTTGQAKGVIHTHASLRASSQITTAGLGATADDHWLACLPLSHIGGFSVVSRALHMGQRLTVLPGFDINEVTRMASSGATLVSLVNTAVQRIDPSIFRKILLGGSSPLTPRPTNVIATYGMTETGSGVVYEGHPLDGVELRTDDEGQIWIKSSTLLRSYTDGTDPKVDGWLPTGDSGSVENGFVKVFGRIAYVINTGGEKVWPEALETALNTHPLIAASRVLGVLDPEWGQRVVAEVQPASAEAPSLEELRDWIKQSMPAYCAPREIRIVASLPRTPSGKLRRG